MLDVAASASDAAMIQGRRPQYASALRVRGGAGANPEELPVVRHGTAASRSQESEKTRLLPSPVRATSIAKERYRDGVQ